MRKYNLKHYNRNSIRKTIPKDLLYERAKLIYEYKINQGWTLERIGRFFGITRERVRQVIEDYEEKRKQLTLT